jgi:rRNA maturation protein Nop10
MEKTEIFYNEELKDYTLKAKIGTKKSIKKVPIKFKMDDKTARFRQEILKKEILEKAT